MARNAPMTEVADHLRELGAEVVLPRFRALETGDIEEKSPGDLVTIVDREVEARLEVDLPGLIPGSRVIGEEGATARPELLDGLAEGWVWTVDPLDGTGNFVAGRPDFAIMVGLLRNGEPVGSWIHQPVTDRSYLAETGSGAMRNGAPLGPARSREGAAPDEALQGLAMTGHFPDELLAAWKGDERVRRFGSGTGTAGIEYPALAEGRWDFLLYWRTFPWDHVPGTLLVVESGGRTARPDGGPYRASDARAGLLSTSCGIPWTEVRKVLSPLDSAHGVSRRPF